MIRRFAILLIGLSLAGCAAKAPPPPPLLQPSPPAGAIPPAPPRGEPSQYLSMAAPDLQTSFGRPAFVRKDGSTEMWRYDGAACRAFFFLYGSPPAVRHVETLPHGADSAADMDCLTALKISPAKAS